MEFTNDLYKMCYKLNSASPFSSQMARRRTHLDLILLFILYIQRKDINGIPFVMFLKKDYVFGKVGQTRTNWVTSAGAHLLATHLLFAG